MLFNSLVMRDCLIHCMKGKGFFVELYDRTEIELIVCGDVLCVAEYYMRFSLVILLTVCSSVLC